MAEDSGKAKYYLLMEELKKEIVSGRRKPGDRLP
ncbi:MAG TPA: GntR family transcriptional regulator, partial [Lachnoclostridium sp.]|nr:GntR family transcriptional regulator [Lachnoclostridium sp.]